MNAYVALGYECNHSCICCPLTTYDRLHGQFSAKELEKKIANLIKTKRGCERITVVLSGGEPLLHTSFFNVAECLLSNNCNLIVLTNSTELCREQVQKRLQKLFEKNEKYKSMVEIVSAIHSSDNLIHDYVTGVKGSLWQTMSGLDYAVSQNINVTVKIILSKINVNSLMETVKYLDEHFPTWVKLQFCGMDYSGRAEKNLNQLAISFDALQSYVEAALDYLEKNNNERKIKNRNCRSVSFFELPLCLCDPYYWRYFYLPSIEHQIYIAPNEENSSFEHISFSNSQCGTFYKECTKCAVKKICFGVWKKTYQHIDNVLRPIIIN